MPIRCGRECRSRRPSAFRGPSRLSVSASPIAAVARFRAAEMSSPSAALSSGSPLTRAPSSEEDEEPWRAAVSANAFTRERTQVVASQMPRATSLRAARKLSRDRSHCVARPRNCLMRLKKRSEFPPVPWTPRQGRSAGSERVLGRRKFSREFKVEAVRLVGTGAWRWRRACRDLDLAESVLRRWMREMDGDPAQAFPVNGQPSPPPSLRSRRRLKLRRPMRRQSAHARQPERRGAKDKREGQAAKASPSKRHASSSRLGPTAPPRS